MTTPHPAPDGADEVMNEEQRAYWEWISRASAEDYESTSATFEAGYRIGRIAGTSTMINGMRILDEASRQKTKMLESALSSIEHLTNIVEKIAVARGDLDNATVADLKGIADELRGSME